MKKAERMLALRQQLAASAGRTRRHEIATNTGAVPHVHIEKSRITLAGLRFMGEEPHPSQCFDCDCGAEDYKDASACREEHLPDCPAREGDDE